VPVLARVMPMMVAALPMRSMPMVASGSFYQDRLRLDIYRLWMDVNRLRSNITRMWLHVSPSRMYIYRRRVHIYRLRMHIYRSWLSITGHANENVDINPGYCRCCCKHQ
jgi:hypothetical protein